MSLYPNEPTLLDKNVSIADLKSMYFFCQEQEKYEVITEAQDQVTGQALIIYQKHPSQGSGKPQALPREIFLSTYLGRRMTPRERLFNRNRMR